MKNDGRSLQAYLELPEASEGDVGDVDDCERAKVSLVESVQVEQSPLTAHGRVDGRLSVWARQTRAQGKSEGSHHLRRPRRSVLSLLKHHKQQQLTSDNTIILGSSLSPFFEYSLTFSLVKAPTL
jgi:hypothetical protein